MVSALYIDSDASSSRSLQLCSCAGSLRVDPVTSLRPHDGLRVARVEVEEGSSSLGSWKRRAAGENRYSVEELELGRFLYPEAIKWRPRTRADCAQVPRPCPYVACKYHLYLDVDAQDTIRVAPGEPWDREESCALDVADRGEHSLGFVAEIMDLTKQRVSQIETRALYQMRKNKLVLRVLK